MKPAAVDYARPRSLSQALELLARPNTDARVIAGGQSLVAMMNLRVASPGLLVDIARLPDLGSVTEEDSTVFYGACVTHAMIEDRVGPDPSQGLMPKVAETLAYRAVRNRGTIGGSLALADPAAEWPAVLAALDATAIIEGWNGKVWGQVPSPALGAPGGILSGVAAVSASSAWAVGGTESGSGPSEVITTLIARWNGTGWKRVPSPNPTGRAALGGVAAVSASSAWAVGNIGGAKTLILRWNGITWKLS